MDQTNHRWSVNENHGDALLAEYRYGDDFYEINVQTGDMEIEIYKSKNCSSRNDAAGICMIAPQQLRAEVPKTQMDGVMGQSIKEEMDDTQISDVDTQRDGLLSTYAMPRLLGASKASSGYTQDFLDGSFTSKVDYTSVTYYHKSDYEDAQLLNGIDVSWWQAKIKKQQHLTGKKYMMQE